MIRITEADEKRIMATNPLKTLRESYNWTQEDFARFAGCSKLLVIRTEQGCYPAPPPVILDFLRRSPRLKEGDYDTEAFLAEYIEFQRLTRQENFGRLNPTYDFEAASPTHPFVAWRESSNLNATQVSKYYCVQQALIYKFEKQHYLLNSLPAPLVDALMESGYGQSLINRLAIAFDQFKQLQSERISVYSLPRRNPSA